MELHTGAIVERVVRRSGVSITELARRTHVNRRSVYNWFNQKRLKLDTICKIGSVIGHDFSIEFPNFFPKNTSMPIKRLLSVSGEPDPSENVYYWMNKYISLLEKYNELLVKTSRKGMAEKELMEQQEGTISNNEANAYSLNKYKVYNSL